MPEVSIVVAIYNEPDYLPKCIESILNQTYTDFELILVNDGSQMNDSEICHAYEKKDNRIIVIDKENGGLSDARNTGMRQASGTYISFVDGDDFLEQQWLERCVGKMKETGADLVQFDVSQYHTQTGEKERIHLPFDENEVTSIQENPLLLVRSLNAAWNKMYKLSLFRDSGIEYPKGIYYEDLGTTYRLFARAEKIAYLNEALYCYLVDRPGNMTTQFNRNIYYIFDVIQMNIDDYKNLGIYETFYEEIKFLGCINILECLKKTGRVINKKETDAFIDRSFAYIRERWPEFPKCKYTLLREKNDWIYAHPLRLKAYLAYRRIKMKGR